MKVSEQIHEIVSEDSSPTLFSEVFGESYRSASGAVTESEYLFLRNGLMQHLELRESSPAHTVRILEYGFGTGLNALVTAAAAARGELPAGTVIEYTSLDLYPLDGQKCASLRYDIDCSGGSTPLLQAIHAAPWIIPPETSTQKASLQKTSPQEVSTEHTDYAFQEILPNFLLRKLKVDFLKYNPLEDNDFPAPWIDVVYFDPFSPECEPECWSEAIFSRIAAAMRPCAILTTYSAKGDVKRALRSAGLTVRRIPGTGRKRHNLVALK